MTRRGFFLVLEGPEGAGKSTLAAALAAKCRHAGVDPVLVREPGGTPIAESARRALLDSDHPIAPETELFLVLAARADLVRQVIRPALEAGRLVLADRYDLSTHAYQVAGRGLNPALVTEGNAAATGGLSPDLTLVLDLPSEIGLERQRVVGKRQDRLDRESTEFHVRVAAAYLAADGGGVQHLDGALAPDRLLADAWRRLKDAAPEIFQVVRG